MGGRMLFPAFPNSRVLPWVLVALSLASLVFGFVDDDREFVVLGAGGLAFVVLAYGVGRLMLRGEPHDESAPEPPE